MENKFIINDHTFIKIVETKEETIDMVKIRYDTFAKRMGINFEDEFDGSDTYAVNFLIYFDNKAVGTIRYVAEENNRYRLGRFAVYNEYRHHGLGKILFQFVENYIKERFSPCTIYFHGMAYLKNFYVSLGYNITSDVFLEENIEHIGFEKRI